MGLSCTVLGASGYSGGELLRLLAGHPALSLAGVAADKNAGEAVARLQPHLAGRSESFGSAEEVARLEADVCFSCLPHGVLDPASVGAGILVDLADDHRWEEGWTYGLTEFARSKVPGSELIVNPGCYPTATLLALVPFARAGAIGDGLVVDAMSGVSGAGRDPADRLLFAGLEGSVGAYGTTAHRHVPEMERGLESWAGLHATISFTPHLVPMARGLLVTTRAPLLAPLDDAQALSILHDAYDSEPFVQVLDTWPQTKAVGGSNRALVHARVDKRAGFVVSSVAIDNLGKGAAGQAIQNANLALGVEEDAGLGSLGVWP